MALTGGQAAGDGDQFASAHLLRDNTALWNGSTLLFSSNWSGGKTAEQALGGGNLVVH